MSESKKRGVCVWGHSGKMARDAAGDRTDTKPCKSFWILVFMDGDLDEFWVEREAWSSSEENL